MRFLTFLAMFIGGIAVIKYREKLQRFSGSVAWAEKFLGVGGTFHMYLLIGLGICIFSVLYITGTLDGFIEATVGRIFLRPGD